MLPSGLLSLSCSTFGTKGSATGAPPAPRPGALFSALRWEVLSVLCLAAGLIRSSPDAWESAPPRSPPGGQREAPRCPATSRRRLFLDSFFLRDLHTHTRVPTQPTCSCQPRAYTPAALRLRLWRQGRPTGLLRRSRAARPPVRLACTFTA